MQRFFPAFFKEKVFKGFFCFFFISLFFPVPSAASCFDLLRNYIRIEKKFKKYAAFEPSEVEVLGHSERFHAHEKIELVRNLDREPELVIGLNPKIYRHKRSEKELDAWFSNIANRVKEIKSRLVDAEMTRAHSSHPQLRVPSSSLMSIEEFLGLLDGAFASSKYPLAKILQDFNIHKIRFVDKKSFDVGQTSRFIRMFKENEIILEIPDVDFENRLEAALWMKSFIMTLHEAAKKYVSHQLDESSNMLGYLRRVVRQDKKSAEQLWYEDSGDGVSFKKKTKKLDMAVGDMLQEITDYIENLTSAYGQNELVKLKEKNFQSLMGSRFLDFGLELSSYTPVGPFTSFVPTHPLHWYEPSRSWLEGKRAIRLEREKLEERMKSYFSRRKRTAISNNIGIALTAISVFNVFKNGAPVNLDDKKDDIREKTNKLNSQKISELSENLQKEYADLEKDLKKAEKANDDSKVLEINTKLNKILKQLEALDDDK